MKSSRYFASLILVLSAVPCMTSNLPALAGEEASSADPAKDHVPVTCLLSGSELDQRVSSVLQQLKQYEEVREVEDGYSLSFPGNDEWTERLIDLVKSERGCCSFFRFELTFEPDQGPIWLYMGGSAEIKAFIATWIQ